ncbi:hypothetical protein HMN09_00211100 [Mycena chlorophos]|uniref:Endonuclease/exonuclease/phosphatase domain-containing protein n=1 Tax=Mycena chlorophos TaxID=658473 RepID=A0A8H6TR09_MYCCL|nr:hypothetical protein HMN09_00211100 [Mycena chlorophos]
MTTQPHSSQSARGRGDAHESARYGPAERVPPPRAFAKQGRNLARVQLGQQQARGQRRASFSSTRTVLDDGDDEIVGGVGLGLPTPGEAAGSSATRGSDEGSGVHYGRSAGGRATAGQTPVGQDDRGSRHGNAAPTGMSTARSNSAMRGNQQPRSRTRNAANGSPPTPPTEPETDELSAPAFFQRKRKQQQCGNPSISRNTRGAVRIAAYNINGIRDNGEGLRNQNHKWHELHRMIFEEKIGILVVNETHMSPSQVEEINDSHMKKRLKIFHSSYPDNTAAKGIALVLNREITNDKGVKFWPLIPGKAFLAQVPWYKKRTTTILGVYAPTESEQHKRDFWNELSEIFLTSERDLPAPDILAGDFNIVESELDRLPSNADDGTTISALRRLTTILGLEDGWRRVNEGVKAFTFVRGESQARLDRIYVPSETFKQYRGWEISDAGGQLSDHKPVYVTLTAPGAPYVGKGRFTIPLHILRDKKFTQFALRRGAQLSDELRALENRTEDRNPQTLYAGFKEDIVNFARDRAKESVGAIEQKRQKLLKERDKMLNPERGQVDNESANEATELADPDGTRSQNLEHEARRGTNISQVVEPAPDDSADHFGTGNRNLRQDDADPEEDSSDADGEDDREEGPGSDYELVKFGLVMEEDPDKRPPWAEIARHRLSKHIVGANADTSTDLKLYLQTWHPNRNELPESLRPMMTAVNKHGVIFDTIEPTAALMEQLPIWHHFAGKEGELRSSLTKHAIPITLLLLSAGFAFTDIACLTGNNFSAQSSVAGGGAICTNAELISWAISLGTNAACTLLIGFKAWNHRRIMKDALGDLKPVRDPSRMSVDRTLSLLVESGFIYCLFWLTQVILFVPVGPHGSPESLAYEVLGALGDQLSGLYPTLIILIVNARRTVWDSDKNDAEWRSGISTVRFGPMASAGRSGTQHLSGIGDAQTPIDSEEDHDATGSQSWNSLKNGSQLRVENGEAIELS